MKLLIALFGIVVATGSFAQDTETTPAVVERITCSDIQEQITELSEVENPDQETTEQIYRLKNDFRLKCSRSAGKRRSSASGRVVIQVSKDKDIPEEDKTLIEDTDEKTEVTDNQSVADTTESEIKIEEKSTETTVAEEIDEEALLEQELAYLDAGLCADGTKPNKFGCCGDEIFKDLGNTVFACCPKTGGDCFPPIEKKE